MEVTLSGGDESSSFTSLQACTEIGLNCSTNNVTDMFFPHVYNATLYCKSKWGVEKRPQWFGTSMWGKGEPHNEQPGKVQLR